MFSNFVPTFWFLDPGFLAFLMIGAAGLWVWKRFRG
jgi:hypothetical protein